MRYTCLTAESITDCNDDIKTENADSEVQETLNTSNISGGDEVLGSCFSRCHLLGVCLRRYLNILFEFQARMSVVLFAQNDFLFLRSGVSSVNEVS